MSKYPDLSLHVARSIIMLSRAVPSQAYGVIVRFLSGKGTQAAGMVGRQRER